MKTENLTEEHFSAVKEIYEEGIATGNATFQTESPAWNEWDKSHLSQCRFVAIENGVVTGWAALTPVSGRCVYAGVAEVSVYISASHRGKGIGKLLLEKLIKESEAKNIWTLQAGIFPENTPSIKLHENLGFRQVGYREKIGQMKGIWRDTVLLERRSKIVGI
ncbi:MAG: N-acetyltransferase [Bacteroidetes bacterium]|nr:N-acetyltransferase [Bacteroidota bacterium]MBI3483236.1 N-acetyltransferase [Bacteroidota bacterium]